ncbi:MAG: DUF2974 domain-containing protein [Lachnospiraceae bacterium]|nr:DUF2974 domain-containing protein [Lachnospiraceae bacterium]
MADITDYIKWRGDLTFEQSPFNEVDNLIFSFISYVDFSGIVDNSADKRITLREASDRFWEFYTEKEILDKPTLTKKAAFVLRDMAASRRFGDLLLSDFVNEIDEGEQKQFSALKIHLPKDRCYLVFRGTDETIVGWQEDFNMICFPGIPSERRAVEYLIKAMEDEKTADFYIGGHSKGGHLAFYAAICVWEKFGGRILSVYNNDGPGISEEMAASQAYEEALPKLISYVPEQSFFGLMLCHKEPVYVVKSRRAGLLQHDILSWEVMGAELVKAQCVAPHSRNLDKGLKNWLEAIEPAERAEIIKLIFDSFSLAQIHTLGDFTLLTPRKLYDMIRNLTDLKPEQKALTSRCFKLLAAELKKQTLGTYQD